MQRTRVKICGVTRSADALAAAALGADAIGVVLCARSPRNLSPEAAAALRAELPAFVSLTALFVDPDAALVEQTVRLVQPDLLQFHGQEAPAFCAAFGRPYVKAIAMGEGADPAARMREYGDAAGFVLDSHAPGGLGGSGKRFDWDRIAGLEGRLILAGGLSASNVAEAIRRVQPWAVDVSSGVEDAPGLKSAARMRDFFAEVRRGDGG